ncbi:MAG: hypothetical protein Q4E62_05240 [Sutterellaceae bacterium]|nr:hypothetical protein [Sutterellaceae bacterium]
MNLKKIFLLGVMVSFAMSANAFEQIKPKITDSGDTPKSYLLVGNSFTFYSSGLHNIINGLAKAAGTPVKRNRMATIGAADLSWHNVWEYVRPSGMAATYVDRKDGGKIKKYDFTKEKVFDVVVLQDNSTGPVNPQRKEIFEKYVKQHAYDLQCIGIKPFVMMTWSHKGKPEMLEGLANETTRVANDANAMVIPVGLAFAEAEKQRPAIELYRADKFHPSALGTYLEGCVTYATMFHHSPVGLKYYGVEQISPEDALFLQKVAWDTVTRYFGWSNK